mgnify:CR=1 FL=1
MGRRRGQVRVGYRKLSKTYRARLERNGITQRAWEDGADLRVARGKTPKAPKAAPAPDVIAKVISEPEISDLRKLEATFVRPAWIPSWMSIDVAAALSQLPPTNRWKAVHFIPAPDGQPWTMTVELKGRAYPITIEIPGGGGPGSGAREVLDFVNQDVQELRDRQRARGRDVEDVFTDVSREYGEDV